MQLSVRSILVLLSLLTLHVSVHAQQVRTAAETAEYLRLQLLEVQNLQESLRIQAQQLDEDLKPENIERALAGIGSTKPEEFRDYRRRQLTIEKDRVQAQLKIIETSRARLEASIVTAEARAYQESALPLPSPPAQMISADSSTLAQALKMTPFVSLLVLFVTILGLVVFATAKKLQPFLGFVMAPLLRPTTRDTR